MLPPFDLFREDADGQVLWIGVARSMQEAEAKIDEASRRIGGRYLIVDLKTDERQTILSGSASNSASGSLDPNSMPEVFRRSAGACKEDSLLLSADEIIDDCKRGIGREQHDDQEA